MTESQAPAPTITRAATTPGTPRKLFVNLAVRDLQRSIAFFEALGFEFNTQFTDATATCMLLGTDAYFMLLTRERFADFATRPVGDPMRDTSGLYAIGMDSRAEVDEMMKKVLAAGGSETGKMQDHGFMYGRNFHDLDGHHWELFWMDPTMMNG